ncbi:MAG: hypothetical protein ABIT10_10365 [Alteraurantiacibacter sp.]
MTKRLALTAFLACAFVQPLAAQNRPQLSEAEVNAVALYAMPHAFRALQTRCGAQLPGDAYIRTRGDDLGIRLDRASRGRFPAARAALTRLVTSENPQMAVLLEQLPAENVEPLAHELIAGKVQSEVDLADCSKINRVLELLDPLPPENLAALMGVLVLEAQARDNAGGGSAQARRR